MRKLNLTEEDLHNLYDMMYMAEDDKGFLETLKLNKMDKWYLNFFSRVEEVVCGDLDEDT